MAQGLNKDIQQEIVQDKRSIGRLVFQLQSQVGVKGQENKKCNSHFFFS